jgi:hypothetical protein
MQRDKLTEKLIRILRQIDSGSVPAEILEVFVFGSYAQGATDPHDLDLVVAYKYPGPEFYKRQLPSSQQQGLPLLHGMLRLQEKHRAKLADSLRSRREPIHLFLTEIPEELDRDKLVLLWSATDRDWQTKLTQFAPDIQAGRVPREEIFPIERLGDKEPEPMQEACRMVAGGELLLTRLPLSATPPKLGPGNQRRLASWRRKGLVSDKLSKVMPHALAWLESHEQQPGGGPGTKMQSTSGTHRVEMGRPSLARMLAVFREQEDVQRQCLIPYAKRGGPNEMLVFKRGPKWKGRKEERDS